MQIDIERLRNFVRERDAAGAANRRACEVVRTRRETFDNAKVDAERNAASHPYIANKLEGEAYDRRMAQLAQEADDARQRLELAREEQERTSEAFTHVSRLCARALEYARSLPNANLPADLAQDDI